MRLVRLAFFVLILCLPFVTLRAEETPPASSSAAVTNPDAAVIQHQGRAIQLYNAGKYREAIAEWSEVLKIDPSNQYAMESIQRAQAALSGQTPPPSTPVQTAPASNEDAAGAERAAMKEPASEKKRDEIPPVSERSVRIAAAVDAWSVADGADQWKKNFQSVVDGANAALGPTSGTIKTMPGAGIRVMVLKRLENFEIGPSVGVVAGPSAEGNADTNVIGFGPLHTKAEISTTFVRTLLEARGLIPVSERVSFQLGAGGGYASGKEKETDTYTGITNQTTEVSDSWGGFTWEVSPAFVFDVHPVTIEFGVRYAHFPTKKEDATASEFKWNPFAVYAAIGF